ncbi:MAG TPA: DUF4157 domain-containing protein [Myxococcales bacterium]|jgi:hypothetical protein
MKIGNRPAVLPKTPKAVSEAVRSAVAARSSEVAQRSNASTFEGAAKKVAETAHRPVGSVSTFDGAAAAKGVAAQAKIQAQPQVQAQAPAPAPKKGFFASIGSFFSDTAKKVGSAVSNFVGGVGDAVVGVAKNLGETASTFGSGLGKLFKGDFKGAFSDMGKSLVKLVQTPVDAAIMVLGKLVSSVQTAIGVEPVGRKLKADEIAQLRKVYGDTIDYSKVEVKEGDAGLYSMSGRAFVLGNTIYMPPGSVGDTETLVHEMGHIWQHQNGGTDYVSEALWGQYFGDGYDFAKGIDEGTAFGELNPEQQAQLISDAWASGFFSSPGKRFVYQGKDYTDYLNNALSQVRAGKSAP